jgi:sugar phosphate isomerase/epimerase
MYSRRQLGRLALAAFPAVAGAKISSKLHGIQFGLQSYSFNGLPLKGILDVVIKSMVETGLGECDIYSPLIEPPELWEKLRGQGGARGPAPQGAPDPRAEARADLAKWRTTAPLSYFEDIRKKFAKAGIEIYGYSAQVGATEAEFHRCFEISKAMGVKLVTTGAPLSVAKRLAPIAEEHKIMVGLQGNPNMSSTNPDQICKPENYEAGVALSKNFWISLDIGDATGGGYDTLKFVKDHHDRIALLYIKDRKRDRTSMPWGEGDTPVKEILQLIRDKKYPIRCYVDNDYKSTLTRAEDVKRSYEWAKKVLSA